jgi:hypothetical protein
MPNLRLRTLSFTRSSVATFIPFRLLAALFPNVEELNLNKLRLTTNSLAELRHVLSSNTTWQNLHSIKMIKLRNLKEQEVQELFEQIDNHKIANVIVHQKSAFLTLTFKSATLVQNIQYLDITGVPFLDARDDVVFENLKKLTLRATLTYQDRIEILDENLEKYKSILGKLPVLEDVEIRMQRLSLESLIKLVDLVAGLKTVKRMMLLVDEANIELDDEEFAEPGHFLNMFQKKHPHIMFTVSEDRFE